MNPHESLAEAYADELPWLAFLYVSGDLTPDEVVDFEERLLSDQAAREAVAQAAKMAEGLWLATAMDSLTTNQPSPGSVPTARTTSQERSGSRWAMWIGSTIVAAGLAFCVGWWFAKPSATPSTPGKGLVEAPGQEAMTILPHEIEGAGQLLELWTDSQSLMAELDFGPAVEYPAELAGDSALRDNSEPDEDEFAWMLIALSADSPAQPADPAVMEN